MLCHRYHRRRLHFNHACGIRLLILSNVYTVYDIYIYFHPSDYPGITLALPASSNSDPGSHSGPFSPLPTSAIRAFFFIAGRVQHFLPSLTLVELCTLNSHLTIYTHSHRLTNITLLTLTATPVVSRGVADLWDTQPVIRAIGVWYTACKDEFRRNLRSHSWSAFWFLQFAR